MPDRREHPERQSEADMLRQEVAALTVQVEAATRKLTDVLTVESAREQFPSRVEVRRTRRRTALTVAVSVLIAFAVTLVGDNLAIKKCFLGSTSTQHQSTFCNTLFPGYNRVEREQHRLLGRFNGVLATIPRNAAEIRAQKEQIARLQQEEADLRRELADLRRRVERH